jgi:hypothetical protein
MNSEHFSWQSLKTRVEFYRFQPLITHLAIAAYIHPCGTICTYMDINIMVAILHRLQESALARPCLARLDILKTTHWPQWNIHLKVFSPETREYLSWALFLSPDHIIYSQSWGVCPSTHRVLPETNNSHPLWPWFTHSCKVCALPDSTTCPQQKRRGRRRKLFSFPLLLAKTERNI